MPILAPSSGLMGPRLVPFDAVAKPLPIKALGNEVLCLEPASRRGTRMALGGVAATFRAAAPDPRGLVVAGGVSFGMLLNTEVPQPEVDDSQRPRCDAFSFMVERPHE
jgi:hypothetical protein